MKLIIAEKPELGRDIAKAILHSNNEIEGAISNEEYTITWAYGHLLELQEPDEYDTKYKVWNEKDLPIYFKNWKKIPAKDICDKSGKIIFDNQYKRNRLNLITNLLKKTDYVIHAGDPDDEGQNLIDEILEYFNFKGTVKRVFVNDNIEKNIVKAFEHIVDNQSQQFISNSAYARQMTDKCHGINHSRLAGIRLNRKGLSIGRVQTATLGLVVNRDEAIANHVKQSYYDLDVSCNLKSSDLYCGKIYDEVLFKFKPYPALLDNEKHIFNKDIITSVYNQLEDKYNCIVEANEKNILPPLPYSQTTLSSDMNKLYGYSLKQTLDITQALRDKYKAITYNRSDSQYLKEEHYAEAPRVAPIVMKNIGKDILLNFDKKSRCFNDEYAPTHHGIIPQEKSINIDVFSQEEKNVYIAIVEHYLMQFLNPHVKNISSAIIKLKEGELIHTSSSLIENGWKTYFLDKENEIEENINQFIEIGDYSALIVDKNIVNNETKPLGKYTEGSLVKDMTSISKYVTDPILKQALKNKDKGKKGESGSIGTVATRGTIIDTLLKRNFLIMEKNHIVTTKLGKEFYHLIPNDIKTADITAKWWLIQEEIRIGKKGINELMLEDVNEFSTIKDTAYLDSSLSMQEDRIVIGICPICGSKVYEKRGSKGKLWTCSSYKDGCKFQLFENTKRFKDTIKLTSTKVKKLLIGESIESNITSKLGKNHLVYLKLNVKNGYSNFDIYGFVNKKSK